MRRRYQALLIVLVLVGAPFYWLLIDNHEAKAAPRQLDIVAMRRLAAAIPGPRPDRIVVQDIASRRVPGALLVAGGGLQPTTVSAYSFLLRRPGADIVIDSGVGEADARDLGFSHYNREAQAQVQRELRRAGLILFTHEHVDHLGGLLRLPDVAGIAPRTLITSAQARGAADEFPWAVAAVGGIRPSSYRGMAAVAPGVVLIATPGHTPGSQMIFVQLASGREYLFAGDTASMGRSWRWVRARSRLVSDLIAPEDRAAVLAWLRAIHDLARRVPGLVVVPGHDLDDIRNPELSSGIYLDFARMIPVAELPRKK